MLSQKPHLWLYLHELEAACDSISEAYEPPKKKTRAANWASYVARVGRVERQWVEKGWRSPDGLRDALVVLVHRGGGSIKAKASTASLLLTLTANFETRQQKATWAKALQAVLDGQLTPEQAAEMGVMNAAKEAERLKTKAARQSQRLLGVSTNHSVKSQMPEIRTRTHSVQKTGD